MEEGYLEMAPIWDDLESFDGHPWRGVVDLLSAGFPCQPVSLAGKRRAQEDERWLWPHVARVVCEVRPRIVALENVPGLLVRGFGDVLGELAALGFDAEWLCLRASEFGAPHIRRRVFVLAWRERDALRLLTKRGEGSAVDDSGSSRHERGESREERSSGGPVTLADTAGIRERKLSARFERQHHTNTDGRCEDFRTWPPPPTYRGDEWPTGFEPAVRRVADGLSYRLDRITSLGNGVVPVVAAKAFLALAERALR